MGPPTNTYALHMYSNSMVDYIIQTQIHPCGATPNDKDGTYCVSCLNRILKKRAVNKFLLRSNDVYVSLFTPPSPTFLSVPVRLWFDSHEILLLFVFEDHKSR